MIDWDLSRSHIHSYVKATDTINDFDRDKSCVQPRSRNADDSGHVLRIRRILGSHPAQHRRD